MQSATNKPARHIQGVPLTMKIDLSETLKQGIAAHQAGDLAAADAAYRKILSIAPGHADAMHLSGLIAYQRGEHASAIALITGAIDLDDKVALYHGNLGRVCKAAGDDKAAVRAFRDAVLMEPENAVLHADLASALLAAGDADAARARANLALELDPDYADAHLNLGLALQALFGPEHGEAVASFHRALAINPELAGAYLGLGVALHEQGDRVGAIQSYGQAIRYNPGYVEAHCNLGNLERDAMHFEAAVGHYRNALDCQPEQPLVWGNLAVALQEAGQLAEAMAAYDKAIALVPDEPNIRRNRGMALLAVGRFDEGWADYEFRWQTPRFKRLRRDWPVPMWDGAGITCKRILVHAEQGLGDTLQFCRYLSLLQAEGAIVIVECADSLKPLLEMMQGVRSVVRPGGHLPNLDCHVPLMSLPGLLKTTAKTIPATVPYLVAPKAAVRKWQKIAADWPKGRRIGIAWRGSPDHPRDAIRSPGLALFLKLASIADITLVSLQKDGGAEEIAMLADAAMVIDPTADIDDFADSAALIGQLDAVVSCDSAPLHLAGALGVSCYAVLPHVAEWRWGEAGDRSPWYPTMTLIRQPAFGDWETVFTRVAEILER